MIWTSMCITWLHLGPTSARHPVGSKIAQFGPGRSWAPLGAAQVQAGPTYFADSMQHAQDLHVYRYFQHFLAVMFVQGHVAHIGPVLRPLGGRGVQPLK